MGIFSKFFRSSGIEKQLENTYVPLFQGMGIPLPEAKNNFSNILNKIKAESIQEGTSNLPPNFGDILLQQSSTDEKVKSMIVEKKKEGVKEEDIRWWWNLHDLERRIMLEVDEMSRLTLFIYLRKTGLDQKEAAKKVKKSSPIYSDMDHVRATTDEDRPLPYELKDRVNIYLEKKMVENPEEFKKKLMEGSLTFNAFVRKEIKKGNI